MPFRIKVSLGVLLFLAVLVFGVPMVVPIPAAPGTRPLAEVAGNANYVNAAGINLHAKTYPAANPENEATWFVLLHDYAFSSYTFDDFAPRLAEYGNVLSFDRPGFGLTERPLPVNGSYDIGFDPYTAQSQAVITLALLDQLGVDQAVLVGNGMGGRVAIDVALAQPSRAAGLVLMDTPVYIQDGRTAPGWFLNSPQMRRLGPVFLRQLAEAPGEQMLVNVFANTDLVTPELRAKHALTTSVDDWDQALWQVSRVGQPTDVSRLMSSITAPTLVITGEGLPPTTADDAARLAIEMRRVQLAGLADCGRVPQIECPDALLVAITQWWDNVAP